MNSQKMKNQDAFWMSMLNKYEQRNLQLQQEQCNLQHHLEAMQCSMPAALMYTMNKPGDGHQINMAEFMSQLGKPQPPSTAASSINRDCPCGPCTEARNGPQTEESLRSSSASCSCDPCTGGLPSKGDNRDDISSCSPCLATEKQSFHSNAAVCTCEPCEAPKPKVTSGPSVADCSCDPSPQPAPASDDCTCGPVVDNPKTSAHSKQPSAAGSCTCDPASSKPSCTCDPCTDSNYSSQAVSTCSCNPCLPPPTTASMGGHNMLDKLSLFSLESTDLLYMSKLQELANREKQMKYQIQELEHREQAYLDTLRQADEMWACMECCYKERLSDVQQNGDSVRLKFEKMNEQLMDENTRLVDELKDAKLELRQCVERVQGPINRQLEQERRKSGQLESELLNTSRNMANKECCLMKDMNDLQNKWNCSCKTLCELNAQNEQLKREMCVLQCKYNELQKDLINQKLSEAHTLQRLTDTLCMEKAMGGAKSTQCECVSICEDDSLGGLARRLSQTLVAIDECCLCKNIPPDLVDTVQGIKGIVDIVDKGNKKDEPECTCHDDKPPSDPKSGGPGGPKDKGGPDDSENTKPSSRKSSRIAFAGDAPDEPNIAEGTETAGESTTDENIQSEGGVDTETETVVATRKTSQQTSSKELRKTPSRTRSCEAPCSKTSKPSKSWASAPSSKASCRECCSAKMNIQELCPAHGALVPLPSKSSSFNTSKEQEVQIFTKVETGRNVDVDVETEVNLYESATDGINITTTITGSGTLEVITQGPAGIIETTMTYTESGNIEVTTEVTEYGSSSPQLAPCLPQKITTGFPQMSMPCLPPRPLEKSSCSCRLLSAPPSEVSRPSFVETESDISTQADISDVSEAEPTEVESSEVVSEVETSEAPSSEADISEAESLEAEASEVDEPEVEAVEKAEVVESAAEEIEVEEIPAATAEVIEEEAKEEITEDELPVELEFEAPEAPAEVETPEAPTEDEIPVELEVEAPETPTEVEASEAPTEDKISVELEVEAPEAPTEDEIPVEVSVAVEAVEEAKVVPAEVEADVQSEPEVEMPIEIRKEVEFDTFETPAISEAPSTFETPDVSEAPSKDLAPIEIQEPQVPSQTPSSISLQGAGVTTEEISAEASFASTTESQSQRSGAAEFGEFAGTRLSVSTVPDADRCYDVCSPAYAKEGEGVCQDVCVKAIKSETVKISAKEEIGDVLIEEKEVVSDSSAISEQAVAAESSETAADKQSKDSTISSEPTSPRSSQSERRSSFDGKSRIPVPVKKLSKVDYVECDCNKCDCEICAPKIMKEREEQQRKTSVADKGKLDDCTCIPDCTCAVCAKFGSKVCSFSNQGESGGQEGARSAREAQGGANGTDLFLESAGEPVPDSGRQSMTKGGSSGGLCCIGHEPGPPPDCDCVDCICQPCGAFPENFQTRAHPPDCDCVSCLCDPCGHTGDQVCTSREASRQASRAQLMKKSNLSSKDSLCCTGHEPGLPPDCDCIDCICKPCGAFPENYNTRESPPDCDCVTCLCDPCGHVGDQVCRSREASRQASKEAGVHIEGCDCLACRCCACPHKDEKPELPLELIIPPATCKCDECLCIQGVSPKIEQTSRPPIQPVTLETPTHPATSVPLPASVEPVATLHESKDDDIAKHPGDCGCLECSLLRDVCPDSQAIQQAQTSKTEESNDKVALKHPADCECTECICDTIFQQSLPEVCDVLKIENDVLESKIEDMECERLQRKQEIEELQEVMKQIKCACNEAETQASLSTSKQNVTNGQNYNEDLAGFHQALSCLQDKCREKDRMIEAMLDELKLRANSKVFDDMLHKLSRGTGVDYDRTAVCNSLPRPSSHMKKPPNCLHPNFPNCPCAGDQPSSNELTSKASTEQAICPSGASKRLSRLESNSYVTASSGEITADSKSLVVCTTNSRTCKHPNFPSCPCAATQKAVPCPSPDETCPCTSSKKVSPKKKSLKPCPADDGSCPCPPKQTKPERKSELNKKVPALEPSSTKSLQPCPAPDGSCPSPPTLRKSKQAEEAADASCLSKAVSLPDTMCVPTSSSKPKSAPQASSKTCIPPRTKSPRVSNCQIVCPPCDYAKGRPKLATRTCEEIGMIPDSSPMEISEVRRIAPDSLIIKWKPPSTKRVTGYEILVDGTIKSRVLSAGRTSAVLHTLRMKETLNISIFAVTENGRCQPPAKAIYQM